MSRKLIDFVTTSRQRSDRPTQQPPARRVADMAQEKAIDNPPTKLPSVVPPISDEHTKKRHKGRSHFTKKRMLIAFIIVIVLGAAGVFTYLNFTASKITNGGTILDLLAPGSALKTDSQGRTNILIFGTSEGDAAHEDAEGGGGLWLTDSIMLVSLNKTDTTAKMVSIPRDLWVKLDSQCEVGDAAKINAVYECAAGLVGTQEAGPNYSSQDASGAAALMEVVTSVTGIVPQYYAHVNYAVLQQSVDAVGGIDVNITGDGASGIYDTNFDWNCPSGESYTCKHVYYPKDGIYHLDGLQALYLARARGDAGAYSYKNFGLARGDFDRQINQQKILTALKIKAQSAGVLANPIKGIGLLNALGDNITTNISTSEMKTFLTTVKKLESKDITSINLTADTPVVETGTYAGQSIVIATSGLYDYSSIVALVAKQLSTNPAVQENASISIYNGGGTAQAAGKLQTKLEATGFTVSEIGNSTPAGSNNYTIYVGESGAFNKTIDYLTESLIDAAVVTKAAPTAIPKTDADVVIVINR